MARMISAKVNSSRKSRKWSIDAHLGKPSLSRKSELIDRLLLMSGSIPIRGSLRFAFGMQGSLEANVAGYGLTAAERGLTFVCGVGRLIFETPPQARLEMMASQASWPTLNA